jgi:hypothetical protein
MITLGGIKVKVEDIKKFFEITNTSPKYLIEWLENTKDYDMPCLRRMYADKYVIDNYKGTSTPVILDDITVCIPHYIKWQYILKVIRTKEGFRKFKKALNYFERKYMNQSRYGSNIDKILKDIKREIRKQTRRYVGTLVTKESLNDIKVTTMKILKEFIKDSLSIEKHVKIDVTRRKDVQEALKEMRQKK